MAITIDTICLQPSGCSAERCRVLCRTFDRCPWFNRNRYVQLFALLFEGTQPTPGCKSGRNRQRILNPGNGGIVKFALYSVTLAIMSSKYVGSWSFVTSSPLFHSVNTKHLKLRRSEFPSLKCRTDINKKTLMFKHSQQWITTIDVEHLIFQTMVLVKLLRMLLTYLMFYDEHSLQGYRMFCNL